MKIRPVVTPELSDLLDLWERSVRGTHDFVTEEDMQSYVPLVKGYLAAGKSELWVLQNDAGERMGFMGLGASNIDLLFLAPEFLRQGGGTMLLKHAQTLRGELTVDCNEQNGDACAFYKAHGFVVERRSELDDTGRPYPMLHMRKREQAPGNSVPDRDPATPRV